MFVGETRGEKEVIGLHNWIQFYLQEKRGNIDYKGFMSGAKVAFAIFVIFIADSVFHQAIPCSFKLASD